MRAQRGSKKFERHYLAVKPGDLTNLKNPLKKVTKGKILAELVTGKNDNIR